MLNGKMYIIYSPTLISAAMRSKDLSFEPFILEFAAKIVGLSKRQVELVSHGTEIDRVTNLMHSALTSASLSKMVARGLVAVKEALNSIGPEAPLKIPDVSVWVGDIMAHAAMKGLYGNNNPIDDASLIQDLW